MNNTGKRLTDDDIEMFRLELQNAKDGEYHPPRQLAEILLAEIDRLRGELEEAGDYEPTAPDSTHRQQVRPVLRGEKPTLCSEPSDEGQG